MPVKNRCAPRRKESSTNAAGWLAILANAVGLGLYVPSVGVYIAVFSIVFLEVWYLLIARRRYLLRCGTYRLLPRPAPPGRAPRPALRPTPGGRVAAAVARWCDTSEGHDAYRNADRNDMNTQKTRRLNRNIAERLVSDPACVRNVHPLLSDLLTAAAAPGRPAELTSEHASLAAFRAARLIAVPRSRRLTMLKTTVLKLLTVKVAAAAAITTVAAGGVALAASTGALPNPLHGQGLAAASAEASDPAAKHSPAADKDGKEDKDGKSATGNPSPSLVGLCHAYSAGNKTERGKALDNPAFTALITTAGGRDKVDAFCQTLLASAKPSTAASHPAGSPDNDSHPTGAPTGHPTGRPSAKPTH
jgi:hypothetical protein